MGIIRGGLLVIVSVLLFVVFLAGNVLWTLDRSLDYETIKPELVSTVKEVIDEQIDTDKMMNETYDAMEAYCIEGNNSEYVFSEGGYTFEIPCEVVSGQGPDAVVDYAIGSFVEEVYSGESEEVMFDFASLKESIH